eukprot:CAMPEP_0113921954 /NCGR_PEP_ID=MMETSP1159-20121227/1359_1 /TAXON_ID=88271 /ORGANISM="Picocystis salinarum" /LENGTH=231 /DNA_ID=CAMNT_0000922039 /DNA_START=154 /DNA_END=849 /DNA_ORIENTATION=- /assembly_acc=CAM_ASM_000767
MFMCTKPPRGQILAKSSTAPGWTKYFVNAESPGLLLLYRGYLSRKLDAVIHLGNAALHQDLNKQHQFEIRCAAYTWQFKARQSNEASNWFQYICHSMVLYTRLELQSEGLPRFNSALPETKPRNSSTNMATGVGNKSTSQRSQTVENDLVLDMPGDVLHPLQKLSFHSDPTSPRASLLQNSDAVELETSKTSHATTRAPASFLLSKKEHPRTQTAFLEDKAHWLQHRRSTK